MSKPSTPKPMSQQDMVGNARGIMQAEADFNRYGYSNPFGSRSWENGQQNVNLSPDMQGVLGQLFQGLNRPPGEFSSQGIQGSRMQPYAQQAGNSLGSSKARVQGMNGPMQPLPGAQFNEGQALAPGQTAHSVDNAASARDAAGLFSEFVPKPEDYDPMRFADVYDQMFGGRLIDFNRQYGRRQ